MNARPIGFIEWDDAFTRAGDDTSDTGVLKLLCLDGGCTYQVRLVGRPFRFYKHFVPIIAISPGRERDVA
jgi:hypothetical protein